jgi:hypothetical protein
MNVALPEGDSVEVDSVDSGVALVIDSGDAVGLAAGVAVSVFCSQAASSAAPAKVHIYFFIR